MTRGHVIGVQKYYLYDSMIEIREHDGKLISSEEDAPEVREKVFLEMMAGDDDLF